MNKLGYVTGGGFILWGSHLMFYGAALSWLLPVIGFLLILVSALDEMAHMHIAPAGQCMPSRATALTGEYAATARYTEMEAVINQQEELIQVLEEELQQKTSPPDERHRQQYEDIYTPSAEDNPELNRFDFLDLRGLPHARKVQHG